MTAKSIDVIIEKFNPYHDSKGRFASAGAASSFTYAPGKSRAHDLAIERHKERMSSIAPTAAQDKTLKGIESRTRNLKKEQLRVVDRDGNVVMQKQGDKNSVSYSVGEARDNFPGNVTIHNHPDGGTFSTADFSDFGYGATEIRAAAPEGTYMLRNLNYKTKWVDGQKTWLDMRDDLDAASEGFKTHRSLKKPIMEEFEKQVKPIADKWAKRRDEGASQEELNSLAKEYTTKWDALKPQIEQEARAAYVGQYHSWLNSHAGEYGFEYSFTPTSTKARKSYTMEKIEEIEKSTGEIVLDRKIAEDVEQIVTELLKEYPRELQEDTKKSFNIYKTDNDKRLVFGWASIAITVDGEQLEDRQKDMIDPEDLEESAYDYVLNFRDTGEEHIPTMRKKGKLVESCVFTAEKQKAMGIPEGTIPVGWWVGFKIEDDAAWERVKNGTYRMFSIEGKASREPVEKSARNYDEFPSYDMWLEENLDATMDEQKAAKEHYQKTRKKNVIKMDRYEYIQEVGNPQRVAKTFDEILEIKKFNPYHDARGRFASANGATSFTFAPGKSKAHDAVIRRERGLQKECDDKASSLVSKAKEVEPQITSMMNKCAEENGGTMVGLKYAVKSEDSLYRKIKSEVREKGISVEDAASNMKDVNRYTMQLTEDNFVSGYQSTVESLRSQGYEIIRVKNSLANPTAEYRGVNTNVKSPDGSIWELQFHTAKSLEVKEVNHKLYETQRRDETPADQKVALGKQMSQNAASIPTPAGIESIKSF